MRLPLLIAGCSLSLAVVSGCASEDPAGEEVGATDEALTASWAEIDEDLHPPTDAEVREAAKLADADDDARPEELDGDEPAAATPVAPPVLPPTFVRPASCNATTSLDLIVYYERGVVDLLKGLRAHASPCAQYFIAIPKVAATDVVPDSQLHPRRVNGLGVHAFGPQFRATAEFHWGGATKKGTSIKYPGWKSVEVTRVDGQLVTTKIAPADAFRASWYLKGVLFRQRMAKQGYLPQAGDTWHVNELESMWTRSVVAQKAIRQMVHGLADGDPDYDAFADKDPAIVLKTAAEKQVINDAAHHSGLKGVLYIAANGKRLPSESTNAGVDNALKQTLRHRRFWADMAKYVELWGQERYVTHEATCDTNRSLSDQSGATASFLESLPLTAASAPKLKTGPHAGESTVGTALFYLARHYVPVINAAWTNEDLPGAAMRNFVAAEVHAARAFSNAHRFSDGRIGLYFRPKVDPAVAKGTSAAAVQAEENLRLGDRAALALNAAYDGAEGRAIAACGPQGAAGCCAK